MFNFSGDSVSVEIAGGSSRSAIELAEVAMADTGVSTASADVVNSLPNMSAGQSMGIA